MPNVRFLLKEPKSHKDTLIYLFFVYHKNYLKYSTGLKINPKLWNVTTQRAKQTKAFPEYPEFNQVLDELKTATTRFYNDSISKKRMPTTNEIREYLDLNLTFRAKGFEEKPTLFKFIEQYINEKSTIAYNTKKTWINTFNLLKEYAKVRKIALDFEGINLEFKFDFEKFLYEKPREYSANTANKRLSIFKQFLNAATDRGYNTNLAYKSSNFTIKKVQVHDIYLTESEVKAIYELDLTDKPKGYETVKNLFVIGCVTGLRFSDWHKVRQDQIQTTNSKDFIKVVTEKTGVTVSFPLHRYVKEILDKYKDNPLKTLTNQKTNKYIKEIGEMAGINQAIILPTNKAGKREDTEQPKYFHIGTHTARRTFATNAYLAGIDSILIMSITGHTTEREFLKYIKISSEQKAVLMADNSFFKG